MLWSYLVIVLTAVVLFFHPIGLAQSANRSITLYGRIEQLTEHPGATLPVKLKAREPQMDTNPNGKTQPAITGAVTENTMAVQSYPPGFEGTWSGNLTVWSSEYAAAHDQSELAEINKEKDILKKGVSGAVTFHFLPQGNRLNLEPAVITFNGTLDQTSVAQDLQQIFGQQSTALLAQAKQQLAAMGPLPLFALHLGALQSGYGVTGNTLGSNLLKNDLKQLAQGVMEQDIVTSNRDTDRNTGQTKVSFSETALRFYRQSDNQLYVQVVLVGYLPNGQFKDKLVLYGTVTRGQPAAESQLNQLTIDGSMPGSVNLDALRGLLNGGSNGGSAIDAGSMLNQILNHH